MAATSHKASIEKSISERFEAIWSKLTRNQQRFVVAMQECSSKTEAAESIGLKPNTIYNWPTVVDEAVVLMSDSVKDAAIGILANAAAKAAMVKVGGLDSDNERIRQDSATEVLDRVAGKPTQRSEVTGAGGGPVEVASTVRIYVPDNGRG